MWVQGGAPVILGLWGMGGIGKTTLGRGLFDRCAPGFPQQRVHIIENMRVGMGHVGVIQLQRDMLKKLFQDESNLSTKEDGKSPYVPDFNLLLLSHM